MRTASETRVFFISQPTSWWTPAITSLCKGTKLASKGEVRFPNFITGDIVIRIMHREKHSGEFGQLAFIAFLCALRVPSEAWPLRRAYTSDNLDGFAPLDGQAIIGLRGPPTAPVLTLRLASRRNLPHGCILKRPCLCDIAKCVEHKPFPVHFLWPVIRARVAPPGLIFPTYTRRNVNSVLKGVLGKLSIPEASRYSPRGFRMGDAQELKSTGSQWSTVAAAGFWHSLAFKGYVDLTADVARDLSQLLIDGYPFDSDEDCEAV